MAQPRRRILVIDDLATERELMVRMVLRAGYQPEEASSGAQGIEMALRSPPDMILCDLLMPGIDGFGVLARVRAEPRTVLIPFVFVTASEDPKDSSLGFSLGADDYLTKPVNYDDLAGLIERKLNPVPRSGQ